jgi:hypothetical protein
MHFLAHAWGSCDFGPGKGKCLDTGVGNELEWPILGQETVPEVIRRCGVNVSAAYLRWFVLDCGVVGEATQLRVEMWVGKTRK